MSSKSDDESKLQNEKSQELKKNLRRMQESFVPANEIHDVRHGELYAANQTRFERRENS